MSSTGTANFAIAAPSDYNSSTLTNPKIFTSCYVSGNNLGTGNVGAADAFISVNYNPTSDTEPAPAHYANTKQIGSTWGVAYSKQAKRIFTSAVLKRHSGLGPLGSGGIYMIDDSKQLPDLTGTTNFLDFDAIGIPTRGTGTYAGRTVAGTIVPFSNVIGTNAQRGLGLNLDTGERDAQALAQSGRVSFGDLDLSDDGRYLYVMNLFDRRLYEIDLTDAANPVAPTLANKATKIRSWAIPEPCGIGKGVARPWGIDYYRGKPFVAVVCDASTTQIQADLSFSIYELNPTTGVFSSKFTSAMTFPRGVSNGFDAAGTTRKGWFAWTDDWSNLILPDESVTYPQPILSDIEFDTDGSMVLGFIDRTGLQGGWNNFGPTTGNTTLYRTISGGDIVRVYKKTDCTYELESAGKEGPSSPKAATGGATNGEGPGGGEFYYEEFYEEYHRETAMGGLGMLFGKNQVVSTVYDPFQYDSFGLGWFNNTTGNRDKGFEIYYTGHTGQVPTSGTFSKGLGLGDLEIEGELAPIEIGNRVFTDTDKDGIQDAGEAGIDGVTVKLFEGATEVGSTTTANGGQYYFNNANVTGGVKYNTAYEIRIATAQVPLSNLALTTTDVASNGSDLIDNDGTTSGANAIKAFTTGNAGENNHSYDFGFKPVPPPCSIAVTSATASACNAATNTYSTSVVVAYTNPPSGNITITTTDGGSMSVARTGSPQTINLTGLSATGVFNVNVKAAFANDTPCEEVCGSNLYYQMSSSATFTDFCRTLVGSTTNPLKEFGFRQEQPIEQVTTVNYGILTTGQSESRNVRFNFKFQQFNMDLTAATAELRIRYSKKMEFETNSLKLFGNPIAASSVVLQGVNTPGNATTDLDSMAVYTLTAAEVAQLFDANPDSLSYSQVYYGCVDRQNTQTGDNWQLIVRTKPGLCTDGSTPCSFDLSCKKPFVYGSGNACGTHCTVADIEFKRIAKTGYTDVSETTPLIGAPTRFYENDTALLRMTNFSAQDRPQEPNGYYTSLGRPDFDGRFYFSFNFSTPANYKGVSPWKFLPTYSTVCVRQRTPDPMNPLLVGTLGAVIIEAPILSSDFQSYAGYNPTDESMLPNGVTYTYPSNDPSAYTTLCLTGAGDWDKVNCPLQNFLQYSNSLWNARILNVTNDKMTETYYLNFGKSLARAGWTGDMGDDNYYIEVKSKWRMSDQFPWDNTNSFSIKGGYIHPGNALFGVPANSASSTYEGSCNYISANGTTVTKKHFISNPNSVYSGDCNLTACHKVDFTSFAGDYFTGNEVRVPLKIDSIAIDLPSEYGIAPGSISLKYHQNCVENTYNNIVASASTGHIRFTNPLSTTGGDFPRADDCSGFTTAYSLCYNLVKTGTAAPTIYRFPIKIYTRDEFNNIKVLSDSASISESKPDLVLTPLTPILQVQDAGGCQPAQFDFVIQNNTLYDAPNTYFAIESTLGTTPLTFSDGGNVYADPIVAADISTYGGANKFVKLGTIKAGDKRIVRVFANTVLCTDNLKVYTDFGCTYPTILQPNLASATLDQATATYEAVAPDMLSQVMSNITVQNLCDNKTVEIEVKNARLPNINKLLSSFRLPSNVKFVAGTAQIKFPTSGTYTTIAASDITQPAADSLDINLNNTIPFNTICGLSGADTISQSIFRIKFDVEFTACPSNTIDQILYRFMGENYCGKTGINRGAVAITYVGSSGTQNNYALGYSPLPIKICATSGVAQPVTDKLSLKNLGGFGTASGLTSGFDSVVVTLIATNTGFTVSNWAFAAPFNAPFLSTDAQGNRTARFLIPAGIAIGDSVMLQMTYDVTPSVNKLCLTALTPPICFHGQFSSPILLACTTKGINCGATQKSLRGSTLSFRSFECCYGSIGDYVYLDTDNSNTQTAGDTPIKDVKVYLLDNTGAKIDSTLTDMNGLYKFDSLFAGVYSVQFVAPVGQGFATKNIGATDKDSDAGTDGKTGTYTIDTSKPLGDPERDITSVDAGIRFCIPPTITNVATTSATCTNGVVNNNAAVNVTGIAGMTKYAYRTNATDSLWANTATASTTTSIDLTGIANPSVATTYMFRIWGADTTCYNDTTIVLTPSVCPSCSIAATFKQSPCNNNGTTATGTDDYFTVTVSAVSATNGGTSGKYEVVLMPTGTVLNTGGTAYGSPVTVGGAGVFNSDGSTTYQIKVRDMDISGCETTLFPTTTSAACSTIGCKPQICLPVTITRN